MQQPLAIAIISGLLMQIPLTVIVVPLFYRWLDTHGLMGAGREPHAG